MTKEELPIKITEIDCVKIDNMDLTKAGENKILQ